MALFKRCVNFRTSNAWGQVLMTGLTSNTWLSWFGCWSSEFGILIAISQNPLSNGNSYIAYTQSRLSWTTLQSPKNDTYSQPVWSPQLRLFAIIGLQYILTSNDGTTWTNICKPSIRRRSNERINMAYFYLEFRHRYILRYSIRNIFFTLLFHDK